MAKPKPNREEARNLAAAGASFKEIRQETGLRPDAVRNVMSNWSNGASSQLNVGSVQQPMPSYNSTVQDARYITNLNPAGSPEFNRWNERLGGNYDGGGWVTWNRNRGPGDSGMLASDDDMRQFARANAYREMNSIGLMNRGSNESDAAKFIASQSTQTSESSPAKSIKSYKGLNSINAGLNLGGDNILGRREAMKIARGTGKGYDDVITKALGRGMSIGGGAVRQSNRTYGGSGLPIIKGQEMFTSGESSDPLSQMRRVNPGRRQMYSGTYELDGKTTPLVESRRGGVNPMSISGGAGGRGRKGGKGRNRGGGGMADLGAGTSSDSGMGVQPMADYQPMTPEDMQQASTVEGFGALSGGGAGVGGATKLGRAKSRLRQLGIYGRGTSLLGRGLQYGNVLNA